MSVSRDTFAINIFTFPTLPLQETITYCFNYLFNLLGENGKLPIHISTWAPLFLLTIFILIGLVRVNEK